MSKNVTPQPTQLALPAKQVSELSAVKVDNALLKIQLCNAQAESLRQLNQKLFEEYVSLVESMRIEVEADPDTVYNPGTRSFVKPKDTK